MRKTQILGAIIAVLAFSAITVAGASATLWLVKNESLKEGVSHVAESHGTIVLVHEKSPIFNASVECSGLFIGTVKTDIGGAQLDETTEVTNLTGTEKNLVANCKTISGTCGSPVLHAVGLPWPTELVLESGKTFDKFTKTTAGYSVECFGFATVTCEGPIKTTFGGNGSNGAKWEFEAENTKSTKCSDGAESHITGLGEMLGVNVS